MIYVNKPLCTGCGECVEVCPSGAIHLEQGLAVIDQAECTECQVCLEACPLGAILSVSEPAEEKAVVPAELPMPEVIRIQLPHAAPHAAVEVAPAPRRARVLPVVAGALVYVGRELPRILPALLDALGRRMNQPAGTSRTPSKQSASGSGGGRRRRRRGQGR